MIDLNILFEQQTQDLFESFGFSYSPLFEAETKDTPYSKSMDQINNKYKKIFEKLKMNYDAQKAKFKEAKQKEVNALKMKKTKGSIV